MLRTLTPEQLKTELAKPAREINLRGADLRGANLSEAYLSEADLRGAYLRGADLRGANLSEANLSEAYLSEAYLRGADLRGAYLSEADLRGAYLRGIKVNWTQIDLISEILRQHAERENRVIFSLLAGGLKFKVWCWDVLENVALPRDFVEWSVAVLKTYVKEGDELPQILK